MSAMLRLLALKPAWLAEHAEAYAELLGSEAAAFAQAWQRRLAWQLAAAVLALLALVWAGMALLLWASLPPLRLPWVLAALPLGSAGVALLCFAIARPGSPAPAFGALRQQARADLDLLREVGER